MLYVTCAHVLPCAHCQGFVLFFHWIFLVLLYFHQSDHFSTVFRSEVWFLSHILKLRCIGGGFLECSTCYYNDFTDLKATYSMKYERSEINQKTEFPPKFRMNGKVWHCGGVSCSFWLKHWRRTHILVDSCLFSSILLMACSLDCALLKASFL